MGIDGLPIFKSSRQSLWPILGSLSDYPQIKPFLIGAYIGVQKPENPNEFLSEFVNELKSLPHEGIIINENDS